MFTINSEGLTVSLPDLWSAFHWYYLLFLSGAYGLITHLKSLPAVYRYVNTDEGKPKRSDMPLPLALILMLFLRMTIGLPCRVILFVVGIVWAFISLPALGKFPIRNNPAFKEAWRWHMPPEKIY